ncbi:MAG: hypothetical protein HC829_04300, partial [Bacteroidales bacterium]|nr:hypothetical protein [Bacteroidales bacterium]
MTALHSCPDGDFRYGYLVTIVAGEHRILDGNVLKNDSASSIISVVGFGKACSTERGTDCVELIKITRAGLLNGDYTFVSYASVGESKGILAVSGKLYLFLTNKLYSGSSDPADRTLELRQKTIVPDGPDDRLDAVTDPEHPLLPPQIPGNNPTDSIAINNIEFSRLPENNIESKDISDQTCPRPPSASIPELIKLGHVLRQRGDRDGALAAFQAAADAAPNSPNLRVDVAHDLRALDRVSDAEAACRAALDIDPR